MDAVTIVSIIVNGVLMLGLFLGEDAAGWIKDILNVYFIHRREMKQLELDILRERNMTPRDALLKDYHVEKQVYEGYQEMK